VALQLLLQLLGPTSLTNGTCIRGRRKRRRRRRRWRKEEEDEEEEGGQAMATTR
jgi:hypothetical protein